MGTDPFAVGNPREIRDKCAAQTRSAPPNGLPRDEDSHRCPPGQGSVLPPQPCESLTLRAQGALVRLSGATFSRG